MGLKTVKSGRNLRGLWSAAWVLVLFVGGVAQQTLWVTGYLPSYHQSGSGAVDFLTAEDYGKLTHLSHHGPYVNPDGSFNYQPTQFSDSKAEKAVRLAHQHNVTILLCIVAWYDQYIEAINDEQSRNRLIMNTLRLVDRAGYDGVDVDLEPVMSQYIPGITRDNPHYIRFIEQLYDSLQTRVSPLLNRPLLLTAAINGYAGPVFSILHEKFDQINIMTYDLVSPDWGFPVWHDSAVYSAGFMISGRPAPSVETEVQKCLNAGVPAAKLGIGISCDAFRWKGGTGTPTGGVTAPRQQWIKAPTWTRFSYRELITSYYRQEYYRWDDDAKISFLSIDREGASNDEFWSYNDERSCREKVEFVRRKGLGGVIIWELGSGYLPTQPSGRRLPQLSAVHEAIATPSRIELDIENADVRLLWIDCRPNPFNASATIEYRLDYACHAKLGVFNALGQLVEELVDDQLPAGTYRVTWPHAYTDSFEYPSGVYFCRLQADASVAVIRLLLIR